MGHNSGQWDVRGNLEVFKESFPLSFHFWMLRANVLSRAAATISQRRGQEPIH